MTCPLAIARGGHRAHHRNSRWRSWFRHHARAVGDIRSRAPVGAERRARIRRDSDHDRADASCTFQESPPTARPIGSTSLRKSTSATRPATSLMLDAEKVRGADAVVHRRSSTTVDPSVLDTRRHGDDARGRAQSRPGDPRGHRRQATARRVLASRAARHRRGHHRLADRRGGSDRRRRRARSRRLRQPGRLHRATERERPPRAPVA